VDELESNQEAAGLHLDEAMAMWGPGGYNPGGGGPPGGASDKPAAPKVTLRDVVSEGNPNDFFTDLTMIGQGASGSVYLATDVKSGNKVAVKQIIVAKSGKVFWKLLLKKRGIKQNRTYMSFGYQGTKKKKKSNQTKKKSAAAVATVTAMKTTVQVPTSVKAHAEKHTPFMKKHKAKQAKKNESSQKTHKGMKHKTTDATDSWLSASTKKHPQHKHNPVLNDKAMVKAITQEHEADKPDDSVDETQEHKVDKSHEEASKPNADSIAAAVAIAEEEEAQQPETSTAVQPRADTGDSKAFNEEIHSAASLNCAAGPRETSWTRTSV